MRPGIPLLLLVMSCAPTATVSTATTTTDSTPSTTTAPTTTATTPPTTTSTTLDPHEIPDWLGTRPLALRPDGFGEVAPTPPELENRSFRTPGVLPPPPSEEFVAHVETVPDHVVARSTWKPECPVSLDDLAYLTVSHWGFDGENHTGELIVGADHAEAIVEVFSRLHDASFPIEEMRVIRTDELDLPPTGDGNVTTSFVCRPVVGSTSWSMHAYGLAIDINPFHNPYVKGDLVLPELASTYADRTDIRPGMIVEGSVAVTAFDDIGWFWGGRWTTLDDSMHFSANNR